jgi:hypothetical protein
VFSLLAVCKDFSDFSRDGVTDSSKSRHGKLTGKINICLGIKMGKKIYFFHDMKLQEGWLPCTKVSTLPYETFIL